MVRYCSILFSSAKTLRPTSAAWRWASSLSLVYFPCLRLAPEIFFRPSVVLAPVDIPPCKLHLPLCLKAGRWHGVPFRVLAKHLFPGQLGPKRVGRPNSEICFATVKNAPFIGCLIVTIFYSPCKRISSVGEDQLYPPSSENNPQLTFPPYQQQMI